MSIRRRKGTLLGLSLLLGTSSCQLTMADLKALNPSAATLEVHCHPSLIPDHVKLIAIQRASGHIVTDEHQDELSSMAPLASVFIEVKSSAPTYNARIMALQYGLSCPNMGNDDEPPAESVPESTRPDPRSLAMPAQPSAGAEPKSLPRIGVCARPKGIIANEWHGGPKIKGTSTTDDPDDYVEKIVEATVMFYLDANAPPESVWNFGRDTKLRCPGKAPIPYDKWVAPNTGTASQPSGSTNSGTPASPAATSTTAQTGASPASSTSSSTGQGPPLTFLEEVTRQMAIAGALSQGDTSGSLADPKGDRHGIPSGKNVGGISFPPLQAGVAILQIVSAVGLSPKAFVKKVADAARKGQRTVIKELDQDALKLADDLIANYGGQYVMAESLRQAQVIMPFKMAQKFTAGLETKFQAHKIFERRAIEEIIVDKKGLSKAAIDKAVDEVAKKYPSIILSDAEHRVISAELAAAWKAQKAKLKAGDKLLTKADLREIYENVYRKKYPQWLEAIDSYLR